MHKLLTKIILILTLAACATGAVSAQGVGPVGFYTGIESASGTCEMAVTSTCFGNTYVLNSFGEWESHHLTVSLNYFNSQPSGGNGFAVTGGNWSLVVTRNNQYAGTLYGEVTGGSIIYPPTDDENSKKAIEVNLQVTNGLGIFKNKRRKKISGTLKMTTDFTSRETTGRLDMTF